MSLSDLPALLESVMPPHVREALRAQSAAGPYPCRGASCSSMVPYPNALCGSCRDIERRIQSRRSWLETTEAHRRSMLASVPADMRWASFDAPELAARVTGGARMVRKAQSWAKGMLDGKAPRIAIQGPAGVGKTACAVAVFRFLLWQLPYNVIAFERQTATSLLSTFADAPQIGWIRSQSPLGEEPARLAEIIGAPVLVLDDIGGEAIVGQQAIATVAEIIRARHRNGLPTIYTTGYSVEELSRIYGAGVQRRIFDRAGHMDWTGCAP